jgi:glycogen debranching enzyme
MSISQHARAPADIEAAEQQPFYISATGPSARPRRSLKHDDTFAVIDSHGDMGSSAGGLDGLFDKDTRYLSRLELLLNGTQPLLLGSNLRDDNALLTTDLTNPDIYFENRLVLQKDTVHVVRTIFLWRGIAYQRLGIRNHGNQHLRMHLTLSFGNDFADVFEVRGLRRLRRGKSQIKVDAATAMLDYSGIDNVRRCTRLSFDPTPTRLDRGLGAYALELAPSGRTSLFLTVECNADDAGARPKAFFRGIHAPFRERKARPRSAPRTSSSTRCCAGPRPTFRF